MLNSTFVYRSSSSALKKHINNTVSPWQTQSRRALERVDTLCTVTNCFVSISDDKVPYLYDQRVSRGAWCHQWV